MTEAAPRAELAHPLCGADLATLLGALIENRGVALNRLPQATIALLATLARLPSTAAERLYAGQKLRHAGEMQPPVFVVGHWRSGTTHLQNILAHGDFANIGPLAVGLPWDLLGLVRLARPLLERALPEDRYIDRIPVKPTSPQEDEIALASMTRLSYYHGLYFPKFLDQNFDRAVFLDGCSDAEIAHWQRTLRHFLGKIWLEQDRRRLLIKNPVYTARLAMLQEMFPGAKFVHIRRNPYEVFVSTRNFYRVLLPQLALQDYTHVDVDALVLRTFTRLMQRYDADHRAVPEGSLCEVRYEHLEADPLGTVERVYRDLDLPGFAEAEPAFNAYLASIRSYRKNQFVMAALDIAKVDAAWGTFVDAWGYAPPASAA